MARRKPASYEYTVRFRWRAIDEARLRQVLERNFGPAEISIEKAPSHASVPVDRPSRVPPPARSVGERVLGLLQDGRTWRLGELQKALGVRSAASIGHAVADLVTGGEAVKMGWGLYALAGIKPAAALKSLRIVPGSATAQILERLAARPMTAPELRQAIPRTRQAIDQALGALEDAGLIARRRTIAERAAYVYELAGRSAAAERPPHLSEMRAKALSAIPLGGPVACRDVEGAVGGKDVGAGALLRDLERLGLVELWGQGRYRLVQLTRAGVNHPQYDAGAAKVGPIDPSALLIAPVLRIFIIVHVLGEATSREITLLSPEPPPASRSTGHHIQRLEQIGLIEISRRSGKRGAVRHYRLTGRGREIVASFPGRVTMPTAAELRAQLAAAQATWRRALADKARDGRFHETHLGVPPLRSRYDAIEQLLRDRGPRETTAINALLPDPYPNPRSISLAMSQLLTAGRVVRLRESNGPSPAVWAAAEIPTPDVRTAGIAGRDPLLQT